MDREWNDSQPIYRQLRDRVVAMILDGVLKEGDPLPSVRNVAAEYRVNPLTVLKGYQQLVDEGLVESKRGLGMYINTGARNLLLQGERRRFLAEEWPRVHATIQRLGLTPPELDAAAKRRSASDVAVLPRWMRVWQALDYFAGVHPRFDRAKAEGFLAKTTIGRASKVRELSKGMVAQLHLALVMAIDAKLLVLDEPTLGLDILYRKQFYDSLLNDYFDRSRTIVVTTHQVEEIQDVLTDVMFINRGRIVFDCSMEEFESRYLEVMVNPEQIAAARALKPIHERQVFGRSILLFDRVERQQLAALGDVRTPSTADLFVAVLSNQSSAAQGGTR